MKKYFLLYFVTIAFNTHFYAQSTFQKLIGGNGKEYAIDIVESNDGFVFVGYTSSQGAGQRDAYVVKIDFEGNVIWEKTFGGPANDRFTLVSKGNDGGFILIGDTESTGQGGADVLITKIDDNGNHIWSRTAGGNINDVGSAFGKIVHTQNGYIFSGVQFSTKGNGSTSGTYLLHIDNQGNTIWSKNYDSNTGNYLVYNSIENNIAYFGGSINFDATFGKIDASTGNVLQSRCYRSSGNESLYNLERTNDGNFLLSDHTWTAQGGYTRFWLMKTNTIGNILWSKLYSWNTISLRGRAIPTSTGGIIMSPFSLTFNPAARACMINTDENGEIIWAKQYGENNYSIIFKAIEVSTGGYIGIGRSDMSNGNEQILIVKTDENGDIENCCIRDIKPEITTVEFTPDEPTYSLDEVTPFTLQNWNPNSSNINSALEEICNDALEEPNVEVINAACPDGNNGSISLNAPVNYQYRFNNQSLPPNPTINNLPAGDYEIQYWLTPECKSKIFVSVGIGLSEIIEKVNVQPIPCVDSNQLSIETFNSNQSYRYKLNNNNWTEEPFFDNLYRTP